MSYANAEARALRLLANGCYATVVATVQNGEITYSVLSPCDDKELTRRLVAGAHHPSTIPAWEVSR